MISSVHLLPRVVSLSQSPSRPVHAFTLNTHDALLFGAHFPSASNRPLCKTVTSDAIYTPSEAFQTRIQNGIEGIPETVLKKLYEKGYRFFVTTNIPKSFPELAKKQADRDVPGSRYHHSLGFLYRHKKQMVVTEFYRLPLPWFLDWMVPRWVRFKSSNPAHVIKHEAAHALVDIMKLADDNKARQAFLCDIDSATRDFGRVSRNLDECLAEGIVSMWDNPGRSDTPTAFQQNFGRTAVYLKQRLKKFS